MAYTLPVTQGRPGTAGGGDAGDPGPYRLPPTYSLPGGRRTTPLPIPDTNGTAGQGSRGPGSTGQPPGSSAGPGSRGPGSTGQSPYSPPTPGNGLPSAAHQAPSDPNPQSSRDATAAVNQFYQQQAKTSDALRNLTANPEDIDRYYKEADAPIQSQFYDQAGQVASYLARQGLGSSAGINVAASQQLSNNKAAIESQARLQATNKALELGRQKLLDAFSVDAMRLQPLLQNKGIDVNATIAQLQLQAQLQMFREQMDAQSDAGWANLLGTGVAVGGTIAIMA